MKMKSIYYVVGLICLSGLVSSLGAWQSVPDTMMTEWGDKVSPENAWREYPRPQMVRENWTNLNGLWDYAVKDREAKKAKSWQGKILVPYCVEAPLSGVGHLLEPTESLWYRRDFEWQTQTGQRLLLHFEAVDYETQVWLNGKFVGSHRGGNLPFSFDITSTVKSGSNELVLKVVDATNAPDSYQLLGKQRLKPGGITYTRVSGIWQTVWLEAVPVTYIEGLVINTNMQGHVSVQAQLNGNVNEGACLQANVRLKGKEIGRFTGKQMALEKDIANPSLWSPSRPTLYDLTVTLVDASGAVLDQVDSYFGIREVGKVRNKTGELVFTLNGNEIFHWGPLDQGWWPDGLLTPPSETAMTFEIKYLKGAGFNMIRKHIKVEPRRYYSLCDRMGMLVWQDHVSGGPSPKWRRLHLPLDENGKPIKKKHWGTLTDPLNTVWPEVEHQQFMTELKGMVDHLHNYPSIVVWVPFNERWGQHKTVAVGRWISEYDPSRLINIASGGNFMPVGDIADEHAYPHPAFPLKDPDFDGFIKVVGEFGGHGYPVKGHLYHPEKRNWGYGGLPKNEAEYRERYITTARELGELKAKGVAGGVYTQTTDVEVEINGLMTYDRKVLKISAEDLKKIHVEAGLTE